MLRIRVHGRGGQGILLGGRILARSLELAGWHVQDRPHDGSERPGVATIAYVQAAIHPTPNAGQIHRPHLVIVVGAQLLADATAGVLHGLADDTVLLVAGTRAPLPLPEGVRAASFRLPLPRSLLASGRAGAACAGAAARLVGLARAPLERAVASELAALGPHESERCRGWAVYGWRALAPRHGTVTSRRLAAPTAAASVDPYREAEPGGARLLLDSERCRRCWWICRSACPQGAIGVTHDGWPHIDSHACNGCVICVVACPQRALELAGVAPPPACGPACGSGAARLLALPS